MKIMNAIVCTDINGAVSFEGNPVFGENSFFKALSAFFTSGTIKIDFSSDSNSPIKACTENWIFEFKTFSDVLEWAHDHKFNEAWLMGDGWEMENLIPLCDHLVIIEFHETAVKSDRKFSFDYSKWKCTMKKECSCDGKKIGVYLYENPGQLKAS